MRKGALWRLLRRWPSLEQLARILLLAKPDVPFLLMGTAGAAVSSSSLLYVPFLAGRIVDGLKDDPNQDDVNARSGVHLLLLLAVVGAISVFFETYCIWMANNRLALRLRKQMFESVMLQELEFFDAKGTGDVVNDVNSSEAVRHLVTTHVSSIVRHGVQVVGGTFAAVSISLPLTAVLLVTAPFVSVAAVLYMMKVMNKLGGREGEASNRCGVCAYETISNARTVKAFSQEALEVRRYGALADAAFASGRRVCIGWAAYDAVLTLVATAGAALLVSVGARLVRAGGLTAGDLSSFFLYGTFAAVSIALLSRSVGEFVRHFRLAQRALELLERVPRLPLAPGGGARPPACDGFVTFRDVSFAYGAGRGPVLRGVSFSLAPGRVVALVGPSGGGKSSIAALLLRLYDPTEGSVALDGRNLRELDPVWLHEHVALVSQEPVLFSFSVEENVRYGCHREVAPAEVERAARAANAHAFIAAMPDGYATPCGERGGRLSGGQKQRVAIARALLMDPRVLVLDEATSALDSESEALVQEALATLLRDRAVLVIAHRLSTVRSAHEVLVVDGGRIVERGTHEELRAADGIYARLVQRQLLDAERALAKEAGCPRPGSASGL